MQNLSDKIRGLSPQLYVQLKCQVQLINDILHRGILYHVQRFPESLAHFRWRIDQKNSSKTKFEEAFEQLTPALIQTMGIQRPMIALKGHDYSYFDRFLYGEKDAPTYLQDVYGIDIPEGDGKLNIGKILSEDRKFHDSKNSIGIQVVDLLATGIRRCLRGQWKDNDLVAELLGGLFITPLKREPVIDLIEFGTPSYPHEDGTPLADSNSAVTPLKIMSKYTRAMLKAAERGGE